jgi:hypothetical protein
MHAVIKSLLAGSVAWLAGNARGYAFDIFRLRGAILYLRAVQAARGLYLVGLATTLCATLAGAGFVLLHIGLYVLLPAPADALTLMGLGVIYLVAGISLVVAFIKEQRWMKASGADETCATLTNRRSED